jgi:hypothetical protein
MYIVLHMQKTPGGSTLNCERLYRNQFQGHRRSCSQNTDLTCSFFPHRPGRRCDKGTFTTPFKQRSCLPERSRSLVPNKPDQIPRNGIGVNVKVHASVYFSKIRFNIIVASDATFCSFLLKFFITNITKFPFNTVTVLE